MSEKVRINNQETPVLQSYAAEVPENGLILEIGACWGWSASKMAAACKDSVKIITIDPWTLAKNKQQPDREKLFHETIAPYRNKITPVKAFSYNLDVEELMAIHGHLDVDLLFIDGDHSYKGCSQDYLKFGEFVKMGGLIVFHDYHTWDGVTKTIDELVVPSEEWDYFSVFRFWVGRRIKLHKEKS